jgi:hypothetical protein
MVPKAARSRGALPDPAGGGGEPWTVPLFLHIPKCAGTTFAHIAYVQYCQRQDTESADDQFPNGVYYFPGTLFFKPRPPRVPERALEVIRRSDLRAVVGHFCFGLHALMPHPAAYLTLLRHPLERILSLYYHLRWDEPSSALGDRGRVFDRTTTIEEFMTGLALREVDNDQVRRISGVEPPFGQCTREMLEQAKANLETFWLVGTTERFEDTLESAHLRLGWPGHIEHRDRNVNTLRPTGADLPPAARDLVLAHNQLDLELHSYANEVLDDHLRTARRPAADARSAPTAAVAGCAATAADAGSAPTGKS